jgi:hypothetical protein
LDQSDSQRDKVPYCTQSGLVGPLSAGWKRVWLGVAEVYIYTGIETSLTKNSLYIRDNFVER